MSYRSDRILIIECSVCKQFGYGGQWAEDFRTLRHAAVASPQTSRLSDADANFVIIHGFCPSCKREGDVVSGKAVVPLSA